MTLSSIKRKNGHFQENNRYLAEIIQSDREHIHHESWSMTNNFDKNGRSDTSEVYRLKTI